MNARPNAWLLQAENDLALAQLARDNGFLAQACYYASQAAEKG
jgi:HEPN domain-containing protein